MAEDLKPPRDAKTALQEYAQSKGMNLPIYREVSRDGPPHDPVFKIEVLIDGEEALHGKGRSKRHAEQKAASALLLKLGVDEGEGA
jgi:ribonuclease-3